MGMKIRLVIILSLCVILDWYIKNNVVPKNQEAKTQAKSVKKS